MKACTRVLLLLALLTSASDMPASAAGVVRHYYIAAEDVDWNYAPSGRDLLHDRQLPMPWGGKTGFRKTRYIEYTDATFTKRKPQPGWLGILGPILRAEVGDTILVDFLNRSNSSNSMHPHGLRYDKNSEGSMYSPAGLGAEVPTTGRFTYRWIADTMSGPGPNDVSSKVWMYHSHVEEHLEVNAGLIGPIIVTARGKARDDGSAKDVDRELVALFQIFDQGVYPPGSHSRMPREQDLFHTINGYVFGNLQGLTLREGEKVRWHLISMGSEKDVHTSHWHGERVVRNGQHTDVVELLPASMESVDMLADNPGTWLFHCQVSDHMEAGMMTTFTVQARPRSCPVRFTGGDFWGPAGSGFQVRFTNASGKTIGRVGLGSDVFIGAGDLRPFYGEWVWEKPLPPNRAVTLHNNDNLHQSGGVLGWAFYPSDVRFADGTEWKPNQRGECFRIFWRDKEHPNVTVLPPVQVDAGDPE